MKQTIEAARRGVMGVLVGALLMTALPAVAHAEKGQQSARPADALLARGAGYDLRSGSPSVARLQKQLRAAGENPGPIDGLFGPLTEAAVTRFQERHGLATDGLVGLRTSTTLRRAANLLAVGAGYAEPRGSARVRALQRRLRAAGEQPGPIDGLFGLRTETAVKRFQRNARLSVDGVVGESTNAALTREPQRARAPQAPAKPKAKPRPTNALVHQSAQTSAWQYGPLLAAAVALLFGLLVLSLRRPLGRFRRRRLARRDRTGPSRAPALPARLALPAEDAAGMEPQRVLGYATTAGAPGEVDGDGLRSQAEAIASACERRGLELLELVRERERDHGKWSERPGLAYALRRIADGEATGLVVAELSKLSRSVTELGHVLEWFSDKDARLLAVAQELDTADGGGRVAARTLMTVSGWERERLAERTRKGMQAARRKGRPSVADYPELKERIRRMRAEAMTLQAIADRLNADGVPTIRGGAKWRPSSVQAAAGYHRKRSGGRLAGPVGSEPAEGKDR